VYKRQSPSSLDYSTDYSTVEYSGIKCGINKLRIIPQF
jgi:hypothetical protein